VGRLWGRGGASSHVCSWKDLSIMMRGAVLFDLLTGSTTRTCLESLFRYFPSFFRSTSILLVHTYNFSLIQPILPLFQQQLAQSCNQYHSELVHLHVHMHTSNPVRKYSYPSLGVLNFSI
jgi:hypothetical protein